MKKPGNLGAQNAKRSDSGEVRFEELAVFVGAFAILVASFGGMKAARGELVPENAVNEALRTTDPYAVPQAQARVLVQQPAPQPVQVIQPYAAAPQPVYVSPYGSQALSLPNGMGQGGNTNVIQVQPSVQAQAGADAGTYMDVTRAGMLKRSRQQTESQNNDMLQERIEQLRLQDEQRRTHDLLSGGSLAPQSTYAYSSPYAPRPNQDQVLIGSAAPQNDSAVITHSTVNLGSAGSLEPSESAQDGSTISVFPRGGVGGFTNATGYDVNSRYALGVGLELGIAPHVSFEVGYTYGEYGVKMSDSNGFYAYELARAQSQGVNPQFDTIAMKQNIIDGGLKLHLLKPTSSFRPYISGGVGYSKSFVNYDQRILSQMNQSMLAYYGRDYEVSSFLGSVGTGFDVKVAKNVSIGAGFKYYAVLSSKESGTLNNYAFYGNQYGAGNYYYGYTNPYQVNPQSMAQTDKSRAAGSLRSSFYTIMGGVTFSF